MAKTYKPNRLYTKQFSVASQWTEIIKNNSLANMFTTTSLLSQIAKAASFNADLFHLKRQGLQAILVSQMLGFEE